MSDNIGGWGEEEVAAPREDSLNSLPSSWEGATNKAKNAAHLIAVAQRQVTRLRSGSFSFAKTQEVAALMLETQMELADLCAEAESRARQSKFEVQYVEGEVAANLVQKALEAKLKRPSEMALKREVSCSDEVKKANSDLVEAEREFKKYRYINDIIKEAHILFRNLEK